MDEPAERSVFELTGGFEAYQDFFYNKITEALKKLPLEATLDLDKVIEDNCTLFPEDQRLKGGLLGLVKEKKNIPYRVIETLQDPLNYSLLNMTLIKDMKPEDKAYWQKKAYTAFTGRQTPDNVVPQVDDLSLGAYLILRIREESDARMAKKD